MKHILRFLIAMTVGVVYGLLFAQKPGKKLRSELSSSKNPYKTLFDELKAVDMEALSYTKDWASNSEDLQKLLKGGREQFDAFLEKAESLGGEAKKQAQQALEDMAKNAKETAKKLSDKATSTGKSAIEKISGSKSS